MITQFSLRNYKAFKAVDVPLTKIHVFIGRNDSGKSSLLEAISAFCRTARADMTLADAFEGRWQGRELVNNKAAESVAAFRATIEFPASQDRKPVEYGFEVFFDPSALTKRCEVRNEFIHPFRQNIIRPASVNGEGTAVGQRTGTSGVQRAQHLLDVVGEALGSAQLFRFEPKLMALPAAIREGRRFRLDSDGFGLPNVLDDILGFDAEAFVKLSKEFCEFFPEFKRVRVETDKGVSRGTSPFGPTLSGEGVGKRIYFETRDGNQIRAEQASDGTILFLGFLALLHMPEPPALWLVEEPEKGVYPKRLDQIIMMLRRALQHREARESPQVIFTTHSPYVLSEFDPDEVTLLSRKEDHSIARPLNSAPYIRERIADGFSLGELWYNLDEEELFLDNQLHRD